MNSLFIKSVTFTVTYFVNTYVPTKENGVSPKSKEKQETNSY